MNGARHEFAATADPTAATVYVSGDFEGDQAERFDLAFAELLGTRAARVVVDMTGVTHLGSAGLGRLMWARELRPNLVLRGLTDVHLRVLEASAMINVFTIE